MNQAIALNPRSSSYYYVLAGLYRRLGKDGRRANRPSTPSSASSARRTSSRRCAASIARTRRRRAPEREDEPSPDRTAVAASCGRWEGRSEAVLLPLRADAQVRPPATARKRRLHGRHRRRRPLARDERLGQRGRQAVPPRGDGRRRRLLRLRQRRLARHLPRQRHQPRPRGPRPPSDAATSSTTTATAPSPTSPRRRGSTHSGWGQGCCVGDYDNDGFDDLFVTYWGKNVLYRNNGDGTFTDVTEKAGRRGLARAAGAPAAASSTTTATATSTCSSRTT